jgi:hypothetical protein
MWSERLGKFKNHLIGYRTRDLPVVREQKGWLLLVYFLQDFLLKLFTHILSLYYRSLYVGHSCSYCFVTARGVVPLLQWDDLSIPTCGAYQWSSVYLGPASLLLTARQLLQNTAVSVRFHYRVCPLYRPCRPWKLAWSGQKLTETEQLPP